MLRSIILFSLSYTIQNRLKSLYLQSTRSYNARDLPECFFDTQKDSRPWEDVTSCFQKDNSILAGPTNRRPSPCHAMSSQSPRLRHYRTMTPICFVCNHPILTYQSRLIWAGGNGWDDFLREQVEESTLKQRLGTGRRDSATQISSTSPPNTIEESSPTNRRRRRSSLAQLTDIFRERSAGKLRRRETMADIAKSKNTDGHLDRFSKRRESSVDGGTKSEMYSKSRRDSAISEIKNEFVKFWTKKEPQPPPTVISATPRRGSGESRNSRRGSGESTRHRRDSCVAGQIPSPGERQHNCRHHRRRQSQQSVDSGGVTPTKYYRNGHRPSVFSTDSTASTVVRDHLDSRQSFETSSSVEARTQSSDGKIMTPTGPMATSLTIDGKPMTNDLKVSSSTAMNSLSVDPKLTERSKNLSLDSATPPTIIMSSVTPPSISPTGSTLPLPGPSLSGRSSPVGTPTHPLFTSRRDSTTQCEYKGKEVSPSKFSRLTRQAAAIDESMLPAGRRGSQPTLLSDVDEGGRKARRDSLSPDSASYPRRQDSRSHLSPDRTVGKRDYSPSRHGKAQLRRQSTSIAGRPPRSPESSSCSSRDPSPGPHGPGHQLDSVQPVPIIRRQSTTDEIFIARGFRRQSTTEEMIRCRNFRRQSSQSDDTVQRYRGRRDSAAQIVNGTFDTMTVEMSNTFFDSSTQTEPSPLYDNNHYHEECLKCDSCHQDLTGPNQRRARRFKNRILCDLHFADVALMESSDFMQQLRSFKPQSLGCALARRKSSATLIFPLPPQACSGEFCKEFPHKLIATPGYWIECSRQQILSEDGTDLEQGEDDDFSPRNDSNYCSYDDSRVYNTDDLPRKKTSIEEQWEKKQEFELTSVDQETYEKYFHSKQHWNYFSNDDELGPVILSFKQELLSDRDHFRVLIRGTSYTVHGLIPASCVFADRYDREEIVRSLGKEVNINPPFTLGQLQGTPDELLKLDKVFIKSELKVGVIYVCEGQYTEEEILANNESSPLFEEFLGILGEKVRLQGFDKYKGGLDTVHDLTGLYSVYTKWRGIEIMFHVSTLLPYDQNDPQKLQRKRHIGNDIVCVVFLETDTTKFSPACIKSHFLHTFILVRVNPHVKRKVTRYSISVVTRDEVGAYKPYLWEQSVFEHGPMFREWLLTKIVNGERASYSAPKFATMQERTRTQMLEDIVRNLTNHAMTGKIPLPYRRGSWRPSDHTRPASPLLDSIREPYENVDQLAEDFTKAFLNTQKNIAVNGNLFDVSFLVSNEQKEKVRFIAVRAILATRSRVFKEILYGITEGPRSPQVDSEFPVRPAPTLLSPQKLQSSNYLQVPEADSPRPKSMPSSPMMKRAWSRLADWGRSIRKHGTLQNEDRKRWASSHDCSSHRLKEKEKAAQQIALPGLSVCANVYKVDRAKLAQTEFYIKEFDPETVRILLDYLHTGSCPLTCVNVPGLISAAEHYDLPDLLNACFHHAKQFLHIDVVCVMLCSLENYYWCYLSAHELLKMILDFIKSRADLLFEKPDFLTLSESMVEMIMTQEIDAEEIKKFEAMRNWAEHKAQKSEEKNREFKSIMRRLSKDLKLSMIPPQVLIKIVLPSRAIENQRILDALMYQANTGMYRNFDLEDYRKRVQTQESCDYGT